MPRIYRRNGWYYYQFHNKRHALGVKSRKAADAAARRIEREHADPSYRAAHETTLGAAMTAYLEHQRSRGRPAPTMTMHGYHVRHLARVLDQDTPLAAVDAGAVDRYIAQRTEDGAARTTIGKELTTLRGTLRQARRRGEYGRALEEVMPHNFRVDYVPRTASLTEPQIGALIAELDPGRAAVVGFIVATAADWRSVLDACPEDVDWARWQALVRGTKNRRRWRTVAVVLPFFRRMLELAKGHVPFDPWGNVQRDMKAACRRAKVPEVTPRDLRRSHAVILRARGVPLHLIARDLGHVDSTMVERVYAPLDVDQTAALTAAALRTGPKPVQRESRATATKRATRAKGAA
jgi:integrase